MIQQSQSYKPRLIIAAPILSSSRQIWKVIAIRPTTVPAGFQRCGRIIIGGSGRGESNRKETEEERRRKEMRGRGASRWRVQKRIKRRVAVDLPIDNGFHLYNSTPLAPPSIHFAFSPPVCARCVRCFFFTISPAPRVA